MLLYEVVVDEMQSNGIAMVFYLFREAIRKTGEPTHVHSHGQVLPLNMGSTYVLPIRPTENRFLFCADKFGWAVFSFRLAIAVRLSCVLLNKLCVVDLATEKPE